MKLKAGKLKQVAVLFLGTRCDKLVYLLYRSSTVFHGHYCDTFQICKLLLHRGWVQDNSISSFGPATLAEKFLPKKFKGDKDYRAATVEAVRLAMLRGTEFDATFMELINSCNQVIMRQQWLRFCRSYYSHTNLNLFGPV